MDKINKKLLSLQKQELNAVKMYQFLAEKFPEEHRDTLLKLAADEGRHASFCKQRTGEVVKPGDLMVNAAKMGLIFGKKFLLATIAKFEKLGASLYSKLEKDLPEVAAIELDELTHAKKVLAIREAIKKRNRAQ